MTARVERRATGPGLRRLEGRVAIITGGARGIGAASARRIATEGAAVIIADILDAEGEALAAEIRTTGERAIFVHLDVSDEAGWAAVVDRARSEFGGLHVLVNNAGTGTRADVEQETLEGWSHTIGVTQTGVWLGMKHAGPAIKAAGGGSIINMSSILGTVGWAPGSIAYHAAKGAVRLMTKSAALRWARERVRVNSIHPGFIATPLTNEVKGTELERLIIDGCPMGRWGTAEEVAAGVAYLASDDAAFMTGSELYIDGGWTAQ